VRLTCRSAVPYAFVAENWGNRLADIVLVKPEAELSGERMAPPFGILYLASALERAGFSTRLIHESMDQARVSALGEEIVAERPLLVGVSSFTGPSLRPALQLSRAIKRASTVPVVWGGLHATMLPQQTLNNRAIDLAVVAEGEETIVDLARLSANGALSPRTLAAVAGVAYRDNGDLRMNAWRPYIRELDRYRPAWHLLNIERYLYRGTYIYSALGSKISDLKIATVMTSRGCPGRCGYCYNQFVNHGSFRFHSVAHALAEIHGLARDHGVTAVVFEDDCLFAHRKRAIEIIHGLPVRWAASIRADYLARWGESFVADLAAHNCFELRIGAESGSQRVLDLMGKGITVEQIRRSVNLCLEHNINVLVGFMCGVPGETWDETLQTLDLIDELERRGASVAAGPAFFFPYPGTPLFDEAVRSGFRPPANVEEWATGWGPSQPLPPYADRRARLVGFYRIMAANRDTTSLRVPVFAKALQWLARKRWQRRFFRLPLDYYVPRSALRLLRNLGLRKLTGAIYQD
jgi:anaerobic magnesium-protoporphyrin IX monomethyl ester cyclase